MFVAFFFFGAYDFIGILIRYISVDELYFPFQYIWINIADLVLALSFSTILCTKKRQVSDFSIYLEKMKAETVRII